MGRLQLLGQIEGFIFITTRVNLEEVEDPHQRRRLEAAASASRIVIEPLAHSDGIAAFGAFRQRVHDGEAAAIAKAATEGAHVAIRDRAGARLAKEVLGAYHRFTLDDILREAIDQEIVDEEEARSIAKDLSRVDEYDLTDGFGAAEMDTGLQKVRPGPLGDE